MHKGRGAAGRQDETLAAKPAAREFEKARKDDADPFIGSVVPGVSGKYSIQEYLSGGGMGVLYTALNERGEKMVVKFIRPHLLDRGGEDKNTAIQRFLKEAQSAAQVSHPNVIRVYDVGMYRDSFFIAMEYLPGKDLKEMKSGPVFSWQELAPIMAQACDGLQAAHDLGIMHRDLCSNNIRVVDADGMPLVKIMDFGLAKSVYGEDESLTKAESVVGKYAHIAPELIEKASGLRAGYDHRVDIYGLGVLMFRELTGGMPFDVEKECLIISAKMNTEPIRPRDLNPGIPQEVEDIVLKAMARHEDDRFQSAAELKEAIMRSLANAAPMPRPETENMFLQHLLSATEQSASDPLQSLGDMRMEQEFSDENPAIRDTRRRGALGRAVKWVAALAVAAAAAYGAYAYRDEIREFAGMVKHEYVDPHLKPPAQKRPDPAPSASEAPSAQREGFMATIQSTPANAQVYEVTPSGREYIGLTPLNRRFDEGEHQLIIARRGYGQKRVSVSRISPTVSVSLSRPQRSRPEPSEPVPELEVPPAPNEGEMEAPEPQEGQ